MAGTLFVVATPIGNLEDLTFRALRTLREVGLIAAEDTRRTAKLLARYEVRQPLVSLREHNEASQTPRLLARLAEGLSIALVSDAGTPGISDPGARLVRAAIDAGLPVVPIPGPSAITAALSASGVSADQFVFWGFPPSSGPARDAWITEVARETKTGIFFESPHRIEGTLESVLRVKRPIFVHRELTKIHESFVICTNVDDLRTIPGKGEFTVVVPGQARGSESHYLSNAYELYTKLTSGVAIHRDEALLLASEAYGIKTSELKKLAKKLSILAKRHN